MTETSKLSVVLSIEHDQRLDLTADGQVIRGHETFIREYIGMLESGLMARIGNAAYKVLHALALRARILGDARRPGAEEEYQELERMGIVSMEHKGHLFCFPSRDCLMQDTGIGSVHTIDAALEELAELNLVQRITFSQPRRGQGFYGANLYIIHPESFIGKFGSPNGKQFVLAESAKGDQKPSFESSAEGKDGEQKLLPVAAADGEQKVLPDLVTESSLWNTTNCSLKRQDLTTTTTNREAPMDEISRIAEFFRNAIGAEQYGLNEKDARELLMLLSSGFSEAQIREGITCAVEHAAEKNRTASFSFCMRSVRHLPSQPSEIVVESGKSSTGKIVTHAKVAGSMTLANNAGSATLNAVAGPTTCEGKSSAQIVPAIDKSYAVSLEGQDLSEPAHAEMEGLLALIGEHSTHPLTKADARRWKILADDFQELAYARNLTPVELVRKAVEEALDAGSAREGYCAPKLARAILSRWAKEQKKSGERRLKVPQQEIPIAVQVYREVRRRYPARELWGQIGQSVGTEERPLAFWREVLNTWVARGYNPQNLEGPLEWFKQGAIPLRNAGPNIPQRKSGTDAAQNAHGKASPDRPGLQRPIETLEVIQQRLRQNAEALEIEPAAEESSAPLGGPT